MICSARTSRPPSPGGIETAETQLPDKNGKRVVRREYTYPVGQEPQFQPAGPRVRTAFPHAVVLSQRAVRRRRCLSLRRWSWFGWFDPCFDLEENILGHT